MSDNQLSTSIRQQGDAVIIDLAGVLNALSDDTLQAAYAEAEKLDPARVVLNFTDVAYINSSGIAVIVGLLAQARMSKVDISAFGLTEHYRHIFELTRLSDFMSILSDEESALGNQSKSTLEK